MACYFSDVVVVGIGRKEDEREQQVEGVELKVEEGAACAGQTQRRRMRELTPLPRRYSCNPGNRDCMSIPRHTYHP